MKKLSIEQAVWRALYSIAQERGLPCRVYGYEVAERTRRILAPEGRRPLESSILREMRRLKAEGNVHYQARMGTSEYRIEYVKTPTPQRLQEEQHE